MSSYLNILSQKTKEALWGMVDFNDFESGGQECYYYMTLTFKLLISVLSVSGYFFVISKLWSTLIEKIANQENTDVDKQKNSTATNITSASYLELVFGYFGILTYITQCLLKSLLSQSLIYMLNPCHTLNLLLSFCLIMPNNTIMRVLNVIAVQNMFCGWSAIFNPLTTGLSNFEIYMFWVEHLYIVIAPIVIVIGGRYFNKSTLNFELHVISHCFFGCYQRLFLFPISETTLVNLNFTLCPSLGK